MSMGNGTIKFLSLYLLLLVSNYSYGIREDFFFNCLHRFTQLLPLMGKGSKSLEERLLPRLEPREKERFLSVLKAIEFAKRGRFQEAETLITKTGLFEPTGQSFFIGTRETTLEEIAKKLRRSATLSTFGGGFSHSKTDQLEAPAIGWIDPSQYIPEKHAPVRAMFLRLQIEEICHRYQRLSGGLLSSKAIEYKRFLEAQLSKGDQSAQAKLGEIEEVDITAFFLELGFPSHELENKRYASRVDFLRWLRSR
jgi:hypothetical protein